MFSFVETVLFQLYCEFGGFRFSCVSYIVVPPCAVCSVFIKKVSLINLPKERTTCTTVHMHINKMAG